MILTNARDLLAAIQYVSHAREKDGYRPILTAIAMKAEEANLILIAADNYRLAEARVPLSGGVEMAQVLLPLRGVATLVALLKGAGKSAEVGITADGPRVEFTCEGNTAVVTPMDGPYPNAENVFPAKPKFTIALNPRFLADACRAAMRDPANTRLPVYLDFDGPLDPMQVRFTDHREAVMLVRDSRIRS